MSQTKTNPLVQFIPFEEAAQRLQVSQDEMMILVDGAVIRGYRYGKEIYLDLNEVEALRNEQLASQ